MGVLLWSLFMNEKKFLFAPLKCFLPIVPEGNPFVFLLLKNGLRMVGHFDSGLLWVLLGDVWVLSCSCESVGEAL